MSTILIFNKYQVEEKLRYEYETRIKELEQFIVQLKA